MRAIQHRRRHERGANPKDQPKDKNDRSDDSLHGFRQDQYQDNPDDKSGDATRTAEPE
jgi:hypothetical protein